MLQLMLFPHFTGESAMGAYPQKALGVLRSVATRMEEWVRDEKYGAVVLPQIGETSDGQISEEVRHVEVDCCCQMQHNCDAALHQGHEHGRVCAVVLLQSFIHIVAFQNEQTADCYKPSVCAGAAAADLCERCTYGQPAAGHSHLCVHASRLHGSLPQPLQARLPSVRLH
jgi:hypothetical protein